MTPERLREIVAEHNRLINEGKPQPGYVLELLDKIHRLQCQRDEAVKIICGLVDQRYKRGLMKIIKREGRRVIGKWKQQEAHDEKA